MDVNLAKKVDFWVHFLYTSSNIALLEKKSEKKSFPLIAKHIKKKKHEIFQIKNLERYIRPEPNPTHTIGHRKVRVVGGKILKSIR